MSPPGAAPVLIRALRLERDRLGGIGTPYAFWNIVPACSPCNRSRMYEAWEVPEGCIYGPEEIETAKARKVCA